MRLYLSLGWNDERLAFEGPTDRYFFEDAVLDRLTEIWQTLLRSEHVWISGIRGHSGAARVPPLPSVAPLAIPLSRRRLRADTYVSEVGTQ